MRKKFCDRCHCKPTCKRVCKIVDAELRGKGVLKTDKDTGLPVQSRKSVRTVRESDLTGPQAINWSNNIYGAYHDPNE